MAYLLPTLANRRAARAWLADGTPAVLRFEDGRCTPGKLQVTSLAAGLLCLSNLLGQGSRVKLISLTNSGPGLGAAEMLSPISWTQQPFRFLTLDECDQRRLRAAIRSSWELTTGTYNSKSRTSERSTRQLEGRILAGDDEWIDRYRATLVQTNPPRRRLFSIVLRAVALGALLVGTIYVLRVCLLR
jgi:hypothetical protein